MGNQSTVNYGYAGNPGYDSSIATVATSPAQYTQNRGLLEKGLLDPSNYGFGVPMALYRPFVIVPLTLQTNNIATAAQPTSAVTLTAGTGVTSTTLTPRTSAGGVPYTGAALTVLDLRGQGATALTGGNIPFTVQRSIRCTGATGATPVNATVVGYDMYGQYVTCTFATPTDTATTESNKTFSYIYSITVDGDPAANISFGTGDTFGFPLVVTNWSRLVSVSWNNVVAAATTTGFTAADLTNPPTTATTDVRGMYKVQTTASNGSRELACNIFINNPNNITQAYGLIPG